MKKKIYQEPRMQVVPINQLYLLNVTSTSSATMTNNHVRSWTQTTVDE